MTLRWQAADAASLGAVVERSVDGAIWTTLGAPRIEGTDLLVYDDESIAPGRFAYRLRYIQGFTERFSEPVWVDVPAVAKALSAYAKDNEFVTIKGGLLGNKVLTAKEVEALAELPPLPVVRSQLLGLLAAPASRLVGVLAGSVRQVVNVVKAYADKEGGAAPAGAEAPAPA